MDGEMPWLRSTFVAVSYPGWPGSEKSVDMRLTAELDPATPAMKRTAHPSMTRLRWRSTKRAIELIGILLDSGRGDPGEHAAGTTPGFCVFTQQVRYYLIIYSGKSNMVLRRWSRA
jgi:hypothetical protein